MNVDAVLKALNDRNVDYILIGGMNFLLRHEPELTFDIDVWVRDTPENLEKVNRALVDLGAEWGTTEKDWKLVPEDWHWLLRQAVYCVTTRFGALDIFREVLGLAGRYSDCLAASASLRTATGVSFQSLADADMLACQEALPMAERKERRMGVLRDSIRRSRNEQK
jgi:hypothetical protein